MKKIKNVLTVGFTFFLMIANIYFSACSGDKYQVTQEEYEKAFVGETLSNVTISTVGFENVHLKETYCCVGDSYAFYNYYDNLQFYGKIYEVKEGEESCYLYGSEDFEYYTEDNAVWRKSEEVFDKNSLFHNAEFVRLYKISFELLQYDTQASCYRGEITSQGQPFLYTYYFSDKRLKKIEITTSINENYYRIMEFYNYGTTTISIEDFLNG